MVIGGIGGPVNQPVVNNGQQQPVQNQPQQPQLHVVQNGPLQGARVGISQVQPQPNNANQVQADAQDRLGTLSKLWLGAAKVVGAIALAPIAIGAGTLAIAGGVVGGILGAAVLHPKQGAQLGAKAGLAMARLPLEIVGRALQGIGWASSGAISGITHYFNGNPQAQMCAALSQPSQNGIMQHQVAVGNGNNVQQQTVRQIMENYSNQLGAKVSQQEMNNYINMGERIVDAINQLDPNYNGGPIIVTDDQGQQHEVKPGLEASRAISWFAMAKSASRTDNDGQPLTVNRGAMVMQDPDGKLHAFLSSAPTCSRRVSTHFAERSLSPASWTDRLAQASLPASLAKGQPVQYGIEDFSSKMPSGKGCLLFDKMEGRGPQQEIFFKWESAGMPTAWRLTGHSEDWNPLTKLGNAFRSMSRCLAHSMNFVNSRGNANEDWGSHREAAHKGQLGQAVYQPFKDLLNMFDRTNANDNRIFEDFAKEAKTHGLYRLEELVDWLDNHQGNITLAVNVQPQQAQQAIQNLQQQIQDTVNDHGGNIGIDRRGAEVHIDLNTNYLHPPPPPAGNNG